MITHTVTAERAKVAAKAGADIIGHSVNDVEMDAELTSVMRDRGTYYVPTLAVYEPKGGRPTTPLLSNVLEPVFAKMPAPTPVSDAQKARFNILLKNIAISKNAQIPIASGTDAGMALTYHGWATLRELKLLVKGGLTPLEALTAATGTSARALRVAGERGTIAEGKLADLVLVDGRPDEKIDDIENIAAVYLGGRAIDRESLKNRITSASMSKLPVASVSAEIDNFERNDGRAPSGGLWVNYSDSGHDRSHVMWVRGARDSGNHTLLIESRMGQKDHPYVEMMLPFSGGGMLPADLRPFKGISFAVRGDSAGSVVLHTRGVRDNAWFSAPFDTTTEWSTVKIDFSKLSRRGGRLAAQWTGDDVLGIGFELSRAAGERAWIELDDVQLY